MSDGGQPVGNQSVSPASPAMTLFYLVFGDGRDISSSVKGAESLTIAWLFLEGCEKAMASVKAPSDMDSALETPSELRWWHGLVALQKVFLSG